MLHSNYVDIVDAKGLYFGDRGEDKVESEKLVKDV